jgi:hypothetical protein
VKHPIIINSLGKAENSPPPSLFRDLKAIKKQINGWGLRPTKYIMNQSDYEDILKWSKDNK